MGELAEGPNADPGVWAFRPYNAVHANLRVAVGQGLQHHLVVRLPRLFAHYVPVCQRHGGRSVAQAGESAVPGGGDTSLFIVGHNI